MALALPAEAISIATRPVRAMRFNGATSGGSYGQIPAAALPARMSSSEYTLFVRFRRLGAAANNAGYFTTWGGGTTNQPFRIWLGQGVWDEYACGRDSSTDGTPLAKCTQTLDTAEHDLFVVMDNDIQAGTIEFWLDAARLTNYNTTTTGSGSLVTTTTDSLWIGNRSAGDRAFNGDIICLAMWRARLEKATTGQLSGAINSVRRFGPLAQPEDLLFCVVEGKDVGPHKLPIKWNNIGAGRVYNVPLKGY